MMSIVKIERCSQAGHRGTHSQDQGHEDITPKQARTKCTGEMLRVLLAVWRCLHSCSARFQDHFFYILRRGAAYTSGWPIVTFGNEIFNQGLEIE